MLLIDLCAESIPGGVGAKAARLHWLARHGYPVPPAYAVAPDGAGGRPLAEVVAAGHRYAVRSSADVEDGAEHSFAGQFHTELDVAPAEVPAAVARVIERAGGARAGRYLDAAGIDPASVRMGVIVQEMAAPVVSGVVFSRNPMTGLSETIVEAVAGRGDALVAAGITPQRWAYRWGDPIEAPADPLLPAAVVESIVDTATEIEGRFGAPVDLEWVWDGTAVQWVQLRPVTGLDALDVYSNRIAREVLPGIIKPLVWSVNVPLVNRAWIDLFTELIGPNDLEPDDLARPFAYRAYFNMGTIGRIFEALGMERETLELLLGFEGTRQPSFKPSRQTFRHLPRMTVAATRKLRYGRAVEAMLPGLDAELRAFEAAPMPDLDDAALLADIERLEGVVGRVAYANIVVPLLMNAYYGGLRRRLEKRGVDITRLDLAAGDAAYDPGAALDLLHAAFRALPAADQAAVENDGYGALPAGLRADLDGFVARFGHFSDSGNDFSVQPWREDLDRVVELVVAHRPAAADSTRLTWEEAAAGARTLSRLVLDGWYRRARDYRRHRDAVSFQYTRGYGLFRDRFLELARRLVERGRIGAVDDIWYLRRGEVQTLVAGGDLDGSALASTRRTEIEELREVAMPEVIFGNEFVPAPPPDQVADVLEGVPTARGVYRGPVRVVRGRDEFGAVAPGDVLVIPYSDVGWTPLFTRAGAVVAEAGGILSHSSIVAREYGIPCVVSVANACLLPDGALVVVDGYRGTVSLAR